MKLNPDGTVKCTAILYYRLHGKDQMMQLATVDAAIFSANRMHEEGWAWPSHVWDLETNRVMPSSELRKEMRKLRGNAKLSNKST